MRGPEKWRRPARNSEIFFEEKRSRFYAFARRIGEEEEALEFLAALRSRFPDATHHVYAWQTLFPERRGRYSDDGEPQGTAGLPVLDVLRKQEIEQGALYVVRYFGGTLLGGGGLVRAYGRAAALALEAAGIETMLRRRRCHLISSYADAERLRYLLAEAGVYQKEASYGLDVDWEIAFAPEREEEIRRLCAAVSGGNALLEVAGSEYAPAAEG